MSQPVVDLVIPALNERNNIDALFDELEPLLGAPIRHVVLADNGSEDGTPERAAERGAVVVHESQRGYGAACLRALAWIETRDAPPDVVAFLDADLSDDPDQIPTLLKPLCQGEADIAIGQRRALAAPGSLNIVQRFGTIWACTLMWLATGRMYRDLGPLRLARWDTFQKLHMADRTWGWTVELQMKAAILDINVAEIDVPYRRRFEGKSKISGTVRGILAAGWKIMATIAELWWKRRRIRQTAASD